MASTDARPIPIKNTAYRVTFPIWDSDGDLVTGATGLDSEVSKDGGTFTDCASEATEIASASGMYYLDLSSTEMNADTVAIIVKTTSSGAKTTPIVLYPNESGDIDVDVTAISGAAVSTSTAQLGVNVVSMAADSITNTALASSAVSEIQTGLSTLDAPAVRSALGLASANLDTQLAATYDAIDTEVAAIKAKTDNLPATPAAAGDGMTLTNAGIDAIFDRANGVETGYTLRQALRLMASALLGELSGAATTTIVIRDMGDSKTRITATVDPDGNRSALSLDAS